MNNVPTSLIFLWLCRGPSDGPSAPLELLWVVGACDPHTWILGLQCKLFNFIITERLLCVCVDVTYTNVSGELKLDWSRRRRALIYLVYVGVGITAMTRSFHSSSSSTRFVDRDRHIFIIGKFSSKLQAWGWPASSNEGVLRAAW